MDGKEVIVKWGDVEQRFARAEVITITAGAPKEINFWSMKLFFGLIVRSGNSDVREANVQANVTRRTIRNRIVLDFVANQNVTDGETISNNQRASGRWDKFISDRFFVQPIYGEYFRDPFQNIDTRFTAGVGAGYELIDAANVDWSISGGPGYQETHFVEVPAGEPEKDSTPALLFGTIANWDIANWLEFDGQYGMSLVNEKSGRYTHHLVASFETEITSLIDFDVSWTWDRTEDPQPLSDGTVPEQDDFRTTVGLTFEF